MHPTPAVGCLVSAAGFALVASPSLYSTFLTTVYLTTIAPPTDHDLSLSCEDMTFDPRNWWSTRLGVRHPFIFSADCGWMADPCKGWPPATAFGG